MALTLLSMPMPMPLTWALQQDRTQTGWHEQQGLVGPSLGHLLWEPCIGCASHPAATMVPGAGTCKQLQLLHVQPCPGAWCEEEATLNPEP